VLDRDHLPLAAGFAAYAPSSDSAGDTLIDGDVLADESTIRVYFYRVYVTQTDPGGGNPVVCYPFGPTIINRG